MTGSEKTRSVQMLRYIPLIAALVLISACEGPSADEASTPATESATNRALPMAQANPNNSGASDDQDQELTVIAQASVSDAPDSPPSLVSSLSVFSAEQAPSANKQEINNPFNKMRFWPTQLFCLICCTKHKSIVTCLPSTPVPGSNSSICYGL